MGERFRRIRRFAIGRHDLLREIDDEMAFHLESSVRELMASGLDADEAREEARRRFGDPHRHRQACHRIDRRSLGAQQREELMNGLAQDLRVAVRSLRRSKTFFVTTLATLVIAILAITAVYSAVHAVLLAPLPLPDASGWTLLFETNPEFGWTSAEVAPANYFDWRERATSFAATTAYIDADNTLTLTGEGEPELLSELAVLDNFMEALGVHPLLGPGFAVGNTFNSGEETVVLSWSLWQRRFEGDPEIIGRVLTLDGEPRTVVGVMAREFSFPAAGTEVWTPLSWPPEARQEVWFRRAHFMRALARLRPGVSPQAARTELQTIAQQLSSEYPETNRVMGAGLMPLREWIVAGARRPLWILLAAVGLLLLIACVNVAGLQVARAIPRTREIAIRRALGASRWRMTRQVVTESLLLALLGGAIGVPAGLWATRALVWLAPPGLPRVAEIGASLPVVLAAAAVTLATTLIFGLIPALQLSATRGTLALRQGGGGTGSGQRLRGFLVAIEVALAVLLMTGACLLVRSFFDLRGVDAGFDSQAGLAASLYLPKSRYPEGEQVLAFMRELTHRAAALPGVSAVAATDRLPLGGSNWTSSYSIDGPTWAGVAGAANQEGSVEIHHRTLSEGYFETLRVPLYAGRFFDATDRPDSPRVVVINETLARQAFGEESPIGRRITFDLPAEEDSTWRTIIGVAGDELIDSLGSPPRAEVLELDRQDPDRAPTLVLRTAAVEPMSVFPALRDLVHELDPDLPLEDAKTLRQHVDATLSAERFLATLLLIFAALALALALLGLYGLTAYTVNQRHREIGIRLALGARERQIARMVIRQGVMLALAGLAVGLVAALAASRAIESLLFGVRGADPLTFLAVATGVTAVALLSSYLPARRATRVDPAITLREE